GDDGCLRRIHHAHRLPDQLDDLCPRRLPLYRLRARRTAALAGGRLRRFMGNPDLLAVLIKLESRPLPFHRNSEKMPDPQAMSHLDRLEAESIHILREVASEFTNPVMMYSVGKDSSVLLHLLVKAVYPARPPIPMLHVDAG